MKRRLLAGSLVGLVTAGLGVALWTRQLRAAPPLPPLSTLPDFALQGHGGQPVSLASFKGRVWVADFIFTRCAGTCHAMTARLSRLRRELPAEVRFASFSVDPEHDTPEVLAAYGRGFGAGPEWLFVAGPREALYALSVKGFQLAAGETAPPGEQGADGPFLHSSRFVLVDRHARIRGYYDSADESAVEMLRRDAERLVAEPR